MRIPGSLKDTTLGDVLGALHRARATGYLELRERGHRVGHNHLIQLEEGRIIGLESPEGLRLGEILRLEPSRHASRRAGEDWLSRGMVSETQLRGALGAQLRQRLEAMFALSDAELRFHVPRPREYDATAPEPLAAADYLKDRPRRRSAAQDSEAARRSEPTSAQRRAPRDEALRVLGLEAGATRVEVQRAFRALAVHAHPDRHPSASLEKRRQLLQEFAELSRAYHILTG